MSESDVPGVCPGTSTTLLPLLLPLSPISESTKLDSLVVSYPCQSQPIQHLGVQAMGDPCYHPVNPTLLSFGCVLWGLTCLSSTWRALISSHLSHACTHPQDVMVTSPITPNSAAEENSLQGGERQTGTLALINCTEFGSSTHIPPTPVGCGSGGTLGSVGGGSGGASASVGGGSGGASVSAHVTCGSGSGSDKTGKAAVEAAPSTPEGDGSNAENWQWASEALPLEAIRLPPGSSSRKTTRQYYSRVFRVHTRTEVQVGDAVHLRSPTDEGCGTPYVAAIVAMFHDFDDKFSPTSDKMMVI
jgi:hypothetical protein